MRVSVKIRANGSKICSVFFGVNFLLHIKRAASNSFNE